MKIIDFKDLPEGSTFSIPTMNNSTFMESCKTFCIPVESGPIMEFFVKIKHSKAVSMEDGRTCHFQSLSSIWIWS